MIEVLAHTPDAITVRIKRPIERMTLASLAQHLAPYLETPKMRDYTVTCFHRSRSVWSQTQSAPSPAWAIAQVTLPEADRAAWVAAHDTEPDELMTAHPLESGYSVLAEVIE